MSATNTTPTIGLPLFIGTDKPAWLTDFNGAMNTIDGAIANLQTAEGGTASSLAALSQSVEALSGTVSQHTTSLQTITTAVAGNTGSINTINSLIGNGQPTTEDKTIIGAINEIYAEIGGGSSVTAAVVSYDNTTSGLTADDVQEAIDELKADVDAIPTVAPTAANVSYSNTASGLIATTVQGAIDELASVSTSHDYSTTEHVIGKWIDGTTDVYERTYAATGISYTSRTVIDANMTPTNCSIVGLDEAYYLNDNNWTGSVYVTSQVANRFIMNSSGIQVDANHDTVNAYNITVRYLKIE